MSPPKRRNTRRAAPLPKLWEVRPPTPYELQRADDLVRGYALEPSKRRLMHYGVTADGRRVTARSNRMLGSVLSSLDMKAGAPIVGVRIEGSPEILPVANAPRSDPWDHTPTEKHLAVIAQRSDGLLTADNPSARLIRQGDGTAIFNGEELVDIGPQISQRAQQFLALLHQRNTARSAMIDTAYALRIFIELVGDKAVGEITHDDTDIFVHALGSWPANASKRLEYRDLAAPDVVRRARARRAPPLHLRTQQKHVDRLRCFFRYLENREEIRPGLLKGLRLYNRQRMAPKAKLPFKPDQLTTIFTHLHGSRQRTPYMFWAPILALYQGLRINEIGQLYLQDVFEHKGWWYLRITDEAPGQRLKNPYSRRIVPLRQEVIDCGFIEFIEQAKRWGRITLFPDVIWGPNGPGDTISRWFNVGFLRKRCEITDRRHTFHSFRHTFANAALGVNLRKDRIARLLGHTPGTDVLTVHYLGSDDQPDVLLPIVRAIEFPPIAHDRYVPDRFEAVFQRAKREAERNQAMDRRLAHWSPPSLAVLP